ncbi:MAG TPA: hypothetical protein VMI32_13005 [Candidatus Solibacter sp.]|nr:hypothetical protein [Candidatus Solibacter sp.]
MNWKKMAIVFGIGVIVNFYITFVVKSLWNWFAVPSLNAPQISYWTTYGLVLLIRLLADRNDFKELEVSNRLSMMIDACVPEEKRTELTERLVAEDKGLAGRLGGGVIGEALGVSFTLMLGWAVHTFLA